MKKRMILLCSITLLFLIANLSWATTLKFDDISSEIQGWVPDGYGNLNWSNLRYVDSNFNGIAGYGVGTISDPYHAFNASGSPVTISAINGSFDFMGTHITSALAMNLNVNIVGYYDGNWKYEQTVVVGYDRARRFNLNFKGIDELILTAFGGTNPHPAGGDTLHRNFVLDNFTTTRVLKPSTSVLKSTAVPEPSTAVPEPSTMLLLGSGLVGLLGYRKVFNK